MQKKLLSLLFIITIIALAGCTSDTPTAISVTPTEDISAITVVPTPGSSDVATITGILLIDKTNPRAAENAILYLGRILVSDTGNPAVAAFDRKTSIGTQTDATGKFVFTNVPPGNYVLILDRISDSFMLQHPDDGSDMYVTATGGQITDLGELIYSELPIP